MSFAAGEQRRKRKTFGATAPPFIDYLKDILRRYPDGGQILKELIQNADDAGATEVVFIHDERSYEKQTLCTSGLEPYQGAALYTFNDAVFTDEDWRGIQTTGRSVKRNDPNKVGRFGIGFNSVYHITDLPSVFSGKYLGMLDPQEKVFEESPGGSIWCLNDEQERGELLHFQEQFQPFKDVLRQVSKSEWDEIVGTQQYFSGTLFRFPLRREPSEISDNLYDAAKMAELFESFIYDADISLLFLRSVSSVSVVHVNSHGTERLRLKVTSSCSKDVSISRQELELNRRTAVKNIECWSQSKGDTAGQWLVTTGCRGEGQVPQLDSLGAKLSYIPQVDIAFPMNQDQTIDGRLVCFLPLPNNEPNKTGLPVHINACFGLTDNRRHIKWQEEDQKNDEAAIWNECLVKEVLPFVYNAIILDAINLSQNGLFPASKVYQLWPDLQQMQHKDRWHSVSVEMLQHLLKLKESVLYLASNEKNWVGPLKAVFMPSELEDPDIKDAVAKVLISAEENLVHVPNHVIKDIQCAYGGSTTLKWVTPAVVRDILRKRGTSHLHKNVKLLLLEYLLSDGKCHELWGLELLPLSNGTFVSFTNDNVALIDNTQFPRELLPTCKDRFLLKGLKGEIVASLKQLAGTGKYKQIICLDASQVARLTRANLPKDWQKSSSVVSWHIGNSDHPPKEWLQQFWTYLNSHFRNLERFIDIPLIPLSPLTGASKTVTLARLQQKTTLVSQNSKENGLSNGLIKVVTSVGGILVQRDELTEHPDLETYLLNPSPSNILKLFLNLEYAKVESGIKAVSAHDKKELKSFLCMLDFLSNPEKNILLQLPLFKPMTCLTFQGENIAAKSKQALALNSDPYIPADIPVPDAIVQCETEVDTKLLKLLKIELINSAQVAILLVDGVKRKLYQTEDENKIMSWILQHGSTLFSQNLSLWKVCKDLKFIRSTKGEYKKASSVFDPRNKCFEVLFGPDMFPPAAFSTTQMLDSLKQLGMRSAEQEITADNLLQVTTQIDKFHVQSPEEYFAKANEVIKLLNDTNVLSKFTPQQCSQLVNMHWLPCERPGSLNGKPTTCVYKPVDVRHSQFNYIVGQVMPLTKELNERVSKKLGLFNRLPTEKVLENLAAMNVETAAMDNPDTNIVFKEKLHNTYRFMQENIASFKDVLNKKKIKWIWIDNHFASPHDVVLEHPPELDLSSYIKKVPKEFLAYKQLLSYSGVRKALSHEEVYEILDRMKESIDDRRPPHGTQKELEVAKAILTWIWKERKTVNENFPVPVMEEQNFTLKPLSSTVFCDIAKAGLEDLSEDEQFHVIHEEIPRAVAEWLKVPFLSTRILNPEFIGIEQCGQVEPLTVRINNILKEYDEDNDLFKELIQNAEDAGASTCKFMLDFRKHKEPPESLIDPGMSVCQGPCLWAYNNGVFTEDDWVNITRVGAASKEKQIEKIGKFGLGFNSVYHVTDIPSVLSGKSLLILDPNVTHLKKHIQSKANPGIKLNLFQKRLFQKFPGEFKPYDGVFECNLTKSIGNDKFYKGSLFKLPFRTEKEAQTSEISKKVYGEHRICSLQENLTANSQHLLLFLKNVCSVSLEILSEKASMPPLEREKEIVLNVTKSVMGTWQIPDSITKWLKTQDKSLPLLRNEELASKVIDTLVANIVKLTSEQGSQCVTQYWLSYSCIGRNQSLHIVQKTGKDTFSLPIGSIAVPLEKDPSGKYWVVDSIRQDGQVFCFLPLSIKSGLPVQINGSFSVTSNRKGIWETGEKSQWNQALLQDAVLTAYITILLLLKSMSAKGELKNYLYCTFWPDKEKVSTPFQPLVMAFYSAVAQTFSGQDIELFGNGQTWCSIKKARFLHPNIHLDKKVGEIATSEFLSIHNKSFVPVPLPEWLRKSFTGTGFHKIIEERTCDWFAFYKEVVFSRLSNIDTGSRNALLLHAIDMNDGDIDDLLKTSPCIPTQGKQLQFISKLVHAQGKVACLYETEKNRFLEGTLSSLLSPKQIKRLSELGMITDHLSLAEIKERAEKISIVWKQDKRKALSHIQHILDLARDCLHDSNSTHWEALKNIKFIPSHLPKPVNKSETVTLNRPVDVYSFNCRYLVNMTKPTVTSGHYSEQVMSKLGVRQNPALPVVHMQLEKAYLHASEYEEDLISNIAEECYEYLDKKEMDKAQLKAICAWANSFPFVLISGTFVHKRYVAKMLKFDARPYLYELPGQLVRFKNLWKSVGIKKHFTSQQFMHVLQEMKNKYRQTELCQDDFALCLSVINVGLFKEESCVEDGCLIPDTKKVLRPASQLNFNDTPWMPVSDGQLLCHELISRPVARYFGINTTRHHTLQNHEEKHFLPFAKEFGQSEKLTVRISNIIAAYPSKKDILKELIQNADDAQATEIHFIWDNRSHSTEKTFGEKWNSLQGPALCVYNNRVFTPADMEGIQKLGEGGKHDLKGKTGKYGLGFNSVYHLTDCPTILTGDKFLCVFDPNMRYLDCASKQSPGCMYKLDSKFKDTFKDVYNTFLPNHFILDVGTMFRLPIRTSEMAELSEISKFPVTDNDIKELLSTLSDDPDGLIIFLKHIAKIQFHEINVDTTEIETKFSVEIKLDKKNHKKKKSFQNHVQQLLSSVEPVKPCQVFYKMEVLASHIGSTVISQKPKQWIMAEQFGSKHSTDDVESDHTGNTVPQAAVAVLNGSTEAFTGRAFCSLPLPDNTGLPVHVNGNFELDSSRRDMWKQDGESVKAKWNESLLLKVIAPLYVNILHFLCINQSVPRFDLKFLSAHLDVSYLCFFPHVTEKVDKKWHPMINELYRLIDKERVPIIPILRIAPLEHSHHSNVKYTICWSSITNAVAADAPHFTVDNTEPFTAILLDIGMNLVPQSWQIDKIARSFQTAGTAVRTVNPGTVSYFLQNNPLNDPTQTKNNLPLPISQTLIRDKTKCKTLLDFCMKDIDENYASLDGLPLLLTNDKMLRRFNTASTTFLSSYANLFQGYEECFADFINREHKEVLEKGNFIQKLTISNSARYLKPILNLLLNNCQVDPSKGLHVPEKQLNQWLELLWKFLPSHILYNVNSIYQTKTKAEAQSQIDNFWSDIEDQFFDSPIVPVKSQDNKCFLQTVGALSSVILTVNSDVSGILMKLGVLKLDRTFFLKEDILNQKLLNCEDRSAVLKQLCVMESCKSQFDLLSGDELDGLLEFLLTGYNTSQKPEEYQRKLYSLPLFETLQQGRQRINQCREVFLLNTSLNIKFPDFFIGKDESIFLNYSPVNHKLSSLMNIPILNDLEYYIKFILPFLKKCNKTQVLNSIQILMEIQNDANYQKYHSDVVSTLKNIPFVLDINDKLQTASYFYDKSVKLYDVMLPPEVFVPDNFWKLVPADTYKRLYLENLLKACGLKHIVSDEEIMEFAHQIESDAKGDCSIEILQKRSKEVFENLLEKNEQEVKQSFLMKMSSIKFVFPEKVEQKLCKYHQPYASDREVVQIKGSLIKCEKLQERLIWTSMPILPYKWQSEEKTNLLKTAGAVQQPSPADIIENLKNVCKTTYKTPEMIKTRSEILCHSYAVLQIMEFDPVHLDFPLVLVENETVLVKINQTVMVLQEDQEFRPYLYQIPSKLALCREFFKRAGVEETPSAKQYFAVLQEVYKDTTGKETLQPNQVATVRRTVQQLFQLFEKKPLQSPSEHHTLYLPATDGKLYESSSLYFNDTYFSVSRWESSFKEKLLEKLKLCYLGDDIYKHLQMLNLLPDEIRPKMLSEVMSEALVESHIQLCRYSTNCEFTGLFQRHLSSEAFLHGLICLIRHKCHGIVSDCDAENMCRDIFEKINFICCQTLETVILLDEEPLSTSIMETQVYVKAESQGCTFYLKHSDDLHTKIVIEVNASLIKEINALLKNILTSDSLLILGQLLVCDNMEDVQKLLEKNGILNSLNENKGHVGIPEAGSVIPDEWIDTLDMNFLNNFEEGEYVGFRNSSSDEMYCYAIVVEKLGTPSHQFCQKYKIQIGEDEYIEASNLDLYQFKRGPEKCVKRETFQTTSSQNWDLVCSQPQTESVPPTENIFPKSLEEIKKEIDNCLKEIWALPKDERHKLINRLYLRWHPDKNTDNEILANEAFKYLKQKLEELEQNKTGHDRNRNGSSQSDWSWHFRDFFRQWNHDASRHRRGRERFYQRYSSRQYNFWTFHGSERPRPNVAEARRWHRQATCDLSAAQNDRGRGATEWCLFKVHQAVEKALIGAEYRRTGKKLTNLNISSLALKVSQYSPKLRNAATLVQQLQTLGVDAKATQYPNYHPFPHIPNEQFSSGNEAQILSIAEELLLNTGKYINEGYDAGW